MLGINNIALPVPASLEITYEPQPTGGAMTLLRVVAGWIGLNSLDLKQILTSTEGSFTLSVHDPRLNQVRGFQARLSTCRTVIAESDSPYSRLARLYMVMEEIV